jgi:hypothetical protein
VAWRVLVPFPQGTNHRRALAEEVLEVEPYLQPSLLKILYRGLASHVQRIKEYPTDCVQGYDSTAARGSLYQALAPRLS